MGVGFRNGPHWARCSGHVGRLRRLQSQDDRRYGAPWTTGPLAGVPFPVTFGLQGLIVEDAQDTVAATNALRVRVQ